MGRFHRRSTLGTALLLFACASSMPAQHRRWFGDHKAGGEEQRWVASWGASQQIPEPRNALSSEDMTNMTMRQIIRLSLGGQKLRIKLSNAFGTEALHVQSVHIAKPFSSSSSRITPGSDRALTFAGAEDVTIPAGAEYLSDPIDYPMAPLSSLAVTFYELKPPAQETSHPGSRATTYYTHGNLVSAEDLPGAATIEHWYTVAGLEVTATPSARTVVTLGDSITDGHGATTNGNNRWPDVLADRLQSERASRDVGMVNVGTGGNRLLAYGLGPDALARFDRDVLARAAVRYLMVLEGVNDLGVLHGAATTTEPGAAPGGGAPMGVGAPTHGKGERIAGSAGGAEPGQPSHFRTPFAPSTPEQNEELVKQIIAAYQQIVWRAHAVGIKVIGTTITPFGGSMYACDPAKEGDREKINEWILAPGHFDAVVDFAKAVADPQDPTRMDMRYSSGDHLHPSVAGYKAMGAAIPLTLFEVR